MFSRKAQALLGPFCMKVQSYIKQGIELVPVEIEVSLMPGVPNIHFLGQPDALIKESVLRIKSALKNQGYSMPQGQQVVVNLRPAQLKKQSQGLDLAVAAAYLWETGQVPNPPGQDVKLYGELDLQGAVIVPEDLKSLLRYSKHTSVMTGLSHESFEFETRQIGYLNELDSPTDVKPNQRVRHYTRPSRQNLKFPVELSKSMAVVAAGEHPCLFAGPAGSGKTTCIEAIHSLLDHPQDREFEQARQIHRILGGDLEWRPCIQPHHSVSEVAMVGGGYPVRPGIISKAHGGVLVLDELLEFNSQVKESLREPIQKGYVTVARRDQVVKLPARFLLLATSNLCPCGDLVPDKMPNCRYSLIRCRSYLEKLSGPLLGRFHMLEMTEPYSGGEEVGVEAIFQKVQSAITFRKQYRQQMLPNALIADDIAEAWVKKYDLESVMPELRMSRRRRMALVKIARTLADLEAREAMSPQHIDQAMQWTFLNFKKLATIFN